MKQEDPKAPLGAATGYAALMSPDVQSLDYDHPRRKRIRREYWRGEFEAIELKIANENLRAEMAQMKHLERAYDICSEEVKALNLKYETALQALKRIAGMDCAVPAKSHPQIAKDALSCIADGVKARAKGKRHNRGLSNADGYQPKQPESRSDG